MDLCEAQQARGGGEELTSCEQILRICSESRFELELSNIGSAHWALHCRLATGPFIPLDRNNTAYLGRLRLTPYLQEKTIPTAAYLKEYKRVT